MDGLKEFLEAYRYFIYTVLLILLTAIVIKNYWEQIRFWWKCTWYSFPQIGKIASLSKDTRSIDSNGWFSSESTLCSEFNTFYNSFDKNAEDFDRSKAYLSKVDELDRKPFPWYIWIIISVLVAIEALGFAYVLAGFTIPGASESTQQYGAAGIAIIISILLVILTHATGHEIYVNELIKKARDYYNNDLRDNKPNLEKNSKVTLEKDEIDDDDRNYLQIINRIKTNGSVTVEWKIAKWTCALIIIIAIGATIIRGQALEKQLNEEITNIQTNVYSSYPSDLGKSQENADSKALDERQNYDRTGGWITFIILAVLFVFIQYLGIFFGKKWGFAGIESLKAFEYTNSFNTKQDFINYFKQEKENIEKIAQQKLQLLQQNMYQTASTSSTSSKEIELLRNKENRTFLSYVSIKHEESLKHDTEKNNRIEKQKKNSEQNFHQTPINESKPSKVVKTVFCQECGSKVSENSKFCADCGKPIETKPKIPTCPKCNTTYDENVKFCSNDGMKLELV